MSASFPRRLAASIAEPVLAVPVLAVLWIAVLWIAVLLTAAGTAQAQQVWTVDPQGPIAEVEDAIALAADGDVILVRPGIYRPIVLGDKSLTIQGDPHATIRSMGLWGTPTQQSQALSIQDLPVDRHVALRNLRFELFIAPGLTSTVLVGNSRGAIQFEDCAILGGLGPGARVFGSDAVTFTRCTITGGAAHVTPTGGFTTVHAGLWSLASRVHLFDCLVQGGKGKDSDGFYGAFTTSGGPGLRVAGSQIFLSGCVVVGGQAGGHTEFFGTSCGELFEGGPGMLLEGGSGGGTVIHRLDTLTLGGDGAEPLPACTNSPSLPGPELVGQDGVVIDLPQGRRAFGWASPARFGDTVEVGFLGQAGDATWLLFSAGVHGSQALLPLPFVSHVDLTDFGLLFVGNVPVGGQLWISLTAPPAPPGVAAYAITGQALFLDTHGELLASGPSLLQVVQP